MGQAGQKTKRIKRVLVVMTSVVAVGSGIAGILGWAGVKPPWQHPASSTIPPAVTGKPAQTCGVEPGLGDLDNTGWGPSRPLFTMNHPADHPTLDSITDGEVGDERGFLVVKDNADKASGGWCRTLHVHDGEVMLMRMYAENSAGDELGAPNGKGEGVATDVRLRLQVDAISDGGKAASAQRISAFLSANNTVPEEIYNTIGLAADHPFTVDTIEGSGSLYSNAFPAGASFSDDVWSTNGTPLGYKQLDVVLTPGYQYALYVTVLVRVTYLM